MFPNPILNSVPGELMIFCGWHTDGVWVGFRDDTCKHHSGEQTFIQGRHFSHVNSLPSTTPI